MIRMFVLLEPCSKHLGPLGSAKREIGRVLVTERQNRDVHAVDRDPTDLVLDQPDQVREIGLDSHGRCCRTVAASELLYTTALQRMNWARTSIAHLQRTFKPRDHDPK